MAPLCTCTETSSRSCPGSLISCCTLLDDDVVLGAESNEREPLDEIGVLRIDQWSLESDFGYCHGVYMVKESILGNLFTYSTPSQVKHSISISFAVFELAKSKSIAIIVINDCIKYCAYRNHLTFYLSTCTALLPNSEIQVEPARSLLSFPPEQKFRDLCFDTQTKFLVLLQSFALLPPKK